jgi:hypothetical protein
VGLGAKLMAMLGIQPCMLKGVLASIAGLFRVEVGICYSLKNVWWHEAANGVLLAFLHNGWAGLFEKYET